MIRRQLRTTTILLLVIIGCVGAGLYIRFANRQVPVAADRQISASVDLSPISQEVNAAAGRYDARGEGDMAVLRKSASEGIPQRVELVFWGLGEEQMMQNLLQTLNNSGIAAAFFVSGNEASQNPESLLRIYDAGQSIGLSYLSSASDMSAIPGKRAVSDFCLAGAAIQNAVGIWPTQVLTLAQPDDELLAAAYACSIGTVVFPSKVVVPGEVGSEKLAREGISMLKRGAVLCVRLDGSGRNGDLNALCAVLADTDVAAGAKSMLDSAHAPAESLQRAYTTERVAAFTFSGLGNKAELDGVLSALKSANGTATFFVTRDDLTRHPEQIHLVLDMGHSLGIAVQTGRFSTALTLLEDLLYAQDEIKTLFSYDGTLPVRPAYGKATEVLEQACGAGGFTLLSAMVNAVRTEDMRKTDAASVLDEIFPESDGVLQRGQIVHFQMGQYQRSDAMLGDLVNLVAASRSIYTIKPIADILSNQQLAYTYPLPEEAILPSVKGAIAPGQLTGNAMTAIASKYIGIDWVASKAFLPGFTSEEINRLDKKGLVANDSNMVFLTFDDWGTDGIITPLLDVLKAHDAQATFFVRTQNVVYNPNLLRAIAAEGHTIANHTHTHYPLSTDLGTGKKFSELTEEQVAELKRDLVDSHKVLESIVGDMTANGRPSLSLLFRPPTLAVGKNGLEAVFDCGFTHSVSGSYTTQDYKATSASNLASALQKRTKSGSVFILHMSDTSVYTAEALDIYLSEMELRKPDKQFRFASLSEILN